MLLRRNAKYPDPHPSPPISDLRKEEQTEAKKPYRQIMKEEVRAGKRELRRPAGSLLMSALSAGLDVGFSLLLMGIMKTVAGDSISRPATALLMGFFYPIGILFVVLGRSELFTEHTTLAVLPLLNRQTSAGIVIRLWVLIYIGNLVGATLFALLAAYAGPHMKIIDPRVFGEIASPLVNHPPTAIFLGGLLAGWLMGLLSWLVTAARDTISQIFIVWIIAFVIGFGHLQHPIVGSVEVLAALFSHQGVSFIDWARFLLWSTIGSAVGGTVFVALIKFSHVALDSGSGLTPEHESRL